MKLKSLYLILMLTIGTTLMAQEKYEQGVIEQFSRLLTISIEGKEDQLIKCEDKNKSGRACALDQLATMRTEGWEVWNTTSSQTGIYFFIRRKLK